MNHLMLVILSDERSEESKDRYRSNSADGIAGAIGVLRPHVRPDPPKRESEKQADAALGMTQQRGALSS